MFYHSPKNNLDLYRDAWYKLSLLDSAAHHQINSLLYSHLLTHHPPARAVKSHNETRFSERLKANRTIQERLSNPALCYSDGGAYIL